MINNNGKIHLRYYKYNNGNGNFGDEMSPLIVKKISNRDVINTSFSNVTSLIAIGSYLQMAKNNDIIWGTGIRTIDQPINYVKLDVRAVRGPLTKKYLETLKISVPSIYGDPALLYPILFKDKQNDDDYKEKIGFIPHFLTLDYYNNEILPKNIKIISPIDSMDNIIRKIKSSKYIISSSLHGLIMADAYNIPNYWLCDKILSEGTIKFEDYFLSQNRQIRMHNNISAILKSDSEEYGNKINLNMLMNSFPKELKI